MKILSRSFYAEILALQGFPAGLRDSYFIRDKSGYPEFRNNQPFSIAGTRKGFGDPRGTLFFELARLAEARKPPYLLFENVVGLINHDHCRTFATILNTLDRLGYGVEWQCLNSKDFGVPQSRNRVYIVGYLDERCRGNACLQLGEEEKKRIELRVFRQHEQIVVLLANTYNKANTRSNTYALHPHHEHGYGMHNYRK